MKGKGQILVKGKEVQNRSPKEAMANGFAMLTEERRSDGIFGGLSVGFNMTISNLPKYQKTGLLNGEKMKADITKMINAMKVKTPSMKSKIANLSGGNQQKVIRDPVPKVFFQFSDCRKIPWKIHITRFLALGFGVVALEAPQIHIIIATHVKFNSKF